jgi:hypothetical protein
VQLSKQQIGVQLQQGVESLFNALRDVVTKKRQNKREGIRKKGSP